MELSAIKDLETLYLLCDRFSHELRTPLGVALAVVDDHLQGRTLEREDFEDALQSLRKMHEMLEHVREIGAALSPTFRRIGSSEMLNEISAALSVSPRIEVLESAELVLVSDMKLLLRVVRSLERYLFFRAQKSNNRATPEIALLLGGEGILISAGVKLSSVESARFANFQSIKELVLDDHSVAALNLLFVEAACRLLGARCLGACDAERGLWFELFLPVVALHGAAHAST